MISGERQLWQAVIVRALEDAIWVDPNPQGGRSEKVSFNGAAVPRFSANRMRDDAMFWLCTNVRDFQFVCDLAGVQPHKVRAAATRMINATEAERAAWGARGISMFGVRPDGEPRGRRRGPKGCG